MGHVTITRSITEDIKLILTLRRDTVSEITLSIISETA